MCIEAEEHNLNEAKKWISERAGHYLLRETARDLMVWGNGVITPAMIDVATDRAIADYKEIVEKFIKEKTGQLTTKDIAYYEQTRPTA